MIRTANYISQIDPLPLIVFKKLVHTLKYSILDLIYKSLDDRFMDKSLIYSIIRPILKKTSLYPDVLTNDRPISQLSIISNFMERIVSDQLIYYIQTNNFIERFKSAHRKSYYTEITLNHITDTLYNSLDSSDCVSQLLLLVFSSVFIY